MRSHPEQTTSPPLMVRASQAPGQAAGALPSQPTPAGGRAARTWLSRGAPGADGAGGLCSPLPSFCRAGPRTCPRVGCAAKADSAGEAPPAAEGARSPFGAPSTPPRSARAQRDSALGPWSPALRPLETGPPQTHHAALARTLTLALAHNAPRGARSGAPALGFGAPRAILSFPLLGGRQVTSPPAKRGRKGNPRGSPGRRAQGRSWAA